MVESINRRIHCKVAERRRSTDTNPITKSRMKVNNKKQTKKIIIMRMMKIVLFILSIGFVSASAIVSSEQNQEPHDSQLLSTSSSSTSSSFNQRMMMKRQPIIESTNNLYKTNDISDTIRNHNNNNIDRLRQLDDIIKQNDHDDFELSFHQRMMMATSNGTTTSTVSTTCIRNQYQLELAIMNVPSNSLIPTTINICKEIIFIDASTSQYVTDDDGNNVTDLYGNVYYERGIHIINKMINIRCIISRNKKCIIDAQGMSRHLFVLKSSLVLNRISFRNGKEIDTYYPKGGSLFIGVASSNIIVNNCDFIDNTVDYINDNIEGNGGAIYCDAYNNMKLLNVNMRNNDAYDGGAVYSLGNTIQMTNVLFTNNSASYSGGAVYSRSNIFEIMMNVSFINNKASVGGAYCSMFINNITLDNCTMTNNIGRHGGGAIYLYYSYLNISNSLLNNNNAIDGSLVLQDSKVGLDKVVFSNSIFDVVDSDIFLQNFLFTQYGVELFETQLNFRQPPPRRQLIQENFVQIAANASTRRQQQQQPLQACITTYKTLRRQIRLCSNRCIINICQSGIRMNHDIVGVPKPINLSDKNVVFKCQQNNFNRCIIDGQRLPRMFHGSNVNVTFFNIIFANGYSSASGGVINLRSDSFLNLVNCTFLNNSAPTGGGVVKVKDTAFYMSGKQSSFINNTSTEPPLVAYSSELNLYDTLFAGNSMTEYGNGILLYNSKTEIYNNTFLEATNGLDFGCNIYITGDPDNYINDASCLDTGRVY